MLFFIVTGFLKCLLSVSAALSSPLSNFVCAGLGLEFVSYVICRWLELSNVKWHAGLFYYLKDQLQN